MPQEVSDYIVDEYVRMRQESLTEGATFGFTSARTLEESLVGGEEFTRRAT